MKSSTALVALLLCGCATVPAQPPLRLAITIDDLPVHGPLPRSETPQSVASTLIRGLRAGGADQAMGFVNGHWTSEDPTTLQVLTAWRKAGLPLGNHGWAHRNLNELSTAEFEAELTRNEPLLASLGGKGDWHWFRYPFLAEGNERERMAAGRNVLRRHGYKVAAVTMDFSDWQFTAPYARCSDRGDAAGTARLERSYLAAAEAAISRSRQLARTVHGRDIPYVLLLHGGAFTARMMPRLLDLYRTRGFRLISVAEAERDPAYASDVAASADGPPATLEGRAAARSLPVPPPPLEPEQLGSVCA